MPYVAVVRDCRRGVVLILAVNATEQRLMKTPKRCVKILATVFAIKTRLTNVVEQDAVMILRLLGYHHKVSKPRSTLKIFIINK